MHWDSHIKAHWLEINIFWSRQGDLNILKCLFLDHFHRLYVITPFFLLQLKRHLGSQIYFSKFLPTNDPNSCKRRRVNEVYSGVSGPPVSSCFLCAYISWCFLLLLTFKAPAAQSGLMESRRHQLFTYSLNNTSKDGKGSEIWVHNMVGDKILVCTCGTKFVIRKKNTKIM